MPLVGGIYTAWGGDGRRRHRLSRDRRRHLPAAADDADGRDAAGDLALGEGDARRRVVARLLLRRQHRRRRRRLPRSPASICCACSTSRPRRCVARRDQRRWSRSIAYVLAGRTTYEADVVTAPRAGAAPRAARGGLRRDRAVGPDRAGLRSDLDAPAVAAFRRHGLHLLADPRGVPRRPRHRQHRRRDAGARRRVAAARARLVPAAAVRRDRVGGLRADRVAAVLADQPVHRDTPWFTLQLDLVRCFWVVLPGAMLWGASFPLALAAVAIDRAGCGAAGRRRLRRQHGRRHRRLAGHELRADPVDRQLARRAGADHRVGAVGAAHARAVVRRRGADRPASAANAGTRLERRRHGRPRGRDGRRRPARAQRPPAARPAGRLRPLCGDAHRPGRHHLRRRGAERVGRRVASCRTACATITTPARCRRRASRRTCACSACSAT